METTRDLRRRIDGLGFDQARLAAEAAELDQRRRELLVLPHLNDLSPAGARARDELEAVDQQLAAARVALNRNEAVIEALTAALPPEHEVEAATTRCAELAAEAAEAGEEAAEGWAGVTRAVEVLGQALAAWEAARRHLAAARDERGRLVEQFGVEAPALPDLAPGREELVATRDRLLRAARSVTHPTPAVPPEPMRISHAQVVVEDEASDGQPLAPQGGSRWEATA